MRIWSIHPKYLDNIGLVACWRETLLAKCVLLNLTKGYKNHPQLLRFKNTKSPVFYINTYLNELYKEAKNRGYNFDFNKIGHINSDLEKIRITSGQIEYEFNHLLNKLKIRNAELYENLRNIKDVEINDIFNKTPGDIESWENKL